MNIKLSNQIQSEIERQEKEIPALNLPPDYERMSAIYADLLKRGIVRKRESQLRSISDPPIIPEKMPTFIMPNR